MDESQEPLLDNNNIQFPRTERKNKGKLSETTFIPKSKSFALDLQNYNKDSKTKKIENKFIFKVYLHFFGQIVFILIMTLLAFKNKTFNSILSNNKILFIISIIIIFILLIYPLKYEQLLKSLPYNYIYLSLFTISIAYVICKILISFNSNLIEAGAILFIIELIYLIIDSFISNKNKLDLLNTSAFMGLCLLFIGSILYFIKKVNFFDLSLIILIILLFGIYLIYDMNLILLDTRRNFEENDYVLATIFLYIDIFQTLGELIIKFYNSCEPEKKPIKKHNPAKSMIFTGEEEYESLYNQKEEEKKKEDDDDKVVIKRTSSHKEFKLDPNKIIKEDESEDKEDSENEKDKDKKKEKEMEKEIEHNSSFKRPNIEEKLIFENKEEEDN